MNLRIVSRIRMINVIRVVEGLMFMRVSVVFLMRCIRRCLVVMLVVSCMVRVIG